MISNLNQIRESESAARRRGCDCLTSWATSDYSARSLYLCVCVSFVSASACVLSVTLIFHLLGNIWYSVKYSHTYHHPTGFYKNWDGLEWSDWGEIILEKGRCFDWFILNIENDSNHLNSKKSFPQSPWSPGTMTTRTRSLVRNILSTMLLTLRWPLMRRGSNHNHLFEMHWNISILFHPSSPEVGLVNLILAMPGFWVHGLPNHP